MNKDNFFNIKKILDNNNFFTKEKNVYVDNRTKDYSSNFGLQWNKFPLTQFDSHTGLPLTKNRLFDSSQWRINDMKDKIVIELGSGAGRFTEILLEAGCYVFSVEMSNAIFVNAINNKSENIVFIKSSLNNLEFLNNLFDYVLCYGVAQHTPNLIDTYQSCFSFGKKGAKISIDHYAKTYYPTTKSIWRPITKRLDPKTLFKIVNFYVPYFFPIDTFIKTKLPTIISKLVRLSIPIPCANYTNTKNVPQDKKKLIEWAIMDTYDALGAKYDCPLSLDEVKKIGKKIGLNTFEVKKNGPIIILNGKK
tara:strand:- start:271 stop:1188 length:918 start_codon:yes stop_codon:yes gene_type:complete